MDPNAIIGLLPAVAVTGAASILAWSGFKVAQLGQRTRMLVAPMR